MKVTLRRFLYASTTPLSNQLICPLLLEEPNDCFRPKADVRKL